MKLKDWAIVGLAVLAIAQGVGIYLGRRALWEQRVAAANEKAELSRTVHRTTGQLRIASRFVYQGQVQLGAALRAKGQTDHALVRMTIERDSLRRETPATIAIDTTSQTLVVDAALDARDTLGVSVGVHAEVYGMRPVSAFGRPTGLITWRVVREPITLEVGLSCRGADAIAQVSGPRWATIDLREVRQVADVCNERPEWRPFAIKTPSIPVSAGLLGVGVFVCRLNLFGLCPRD